LIDDLVAGVAQSAAFVGESVSHGTTGAGDPLDESVVDHARGERAEGLIALECQLGQVVQRGAGILVEMPQRIPLHKADRKRCQGGVNRAVVTHLKPFHAQT
jgi:hypothetical protein